jgi:Site-specific recombinases, DNA invertase Pin homologs
MAFDIKKLYDENLTVALYLRVSTGYQVEKDSLPHQEKELRAYCEHIMHVDAARIETFIDAGHSGKDTKRPAFELMMRKIKAGLVSHVVVYKIDRISRNLVDFSIMFDTFKYSRVTFVSINEQFDTSSAIGEAMLKIILVFAELERKMTSERVTDIMIGRAREGKWNGARVAFGWKWNTEKERPEHHEIESKFVKQIYKMYIDTKSTARIRNYLNTNNIPTKRGGVWTTKTIADTIRNPMNKGDYRYNYKESARGKKKPPEEVVYIEGAFKPIVTLSLWNNANAIMDENGKSWTIAKPGRVMKQVHIFAGLLSCDKCDSKFHTSRKDRARLNGFTPSLYYCSGRVTKDICDAPGNISEVMVGPFIINYIANMVRATHLKKQIKNVNDLESLLLNGKAFNNIFGISANCLKETFALLSASPSNALYSPATVVASACISSSDLAEDLKQKLLKIDRAMERAKKLFLFNDVAMSEKDYLQTRTELENEKLKLERQLDDMNKTTFASSTNEMTFLKSASSFLITHHLQTAHEIVYSELAATVDDEVLKDFVDLIIRQIRIRDKRIVSITFCNGLKHDFIYKE